jgi:hypothetical protein
MDTFEALTADQIDAAQQLKALTAPVVQVRLWLGHQRVKGTLRVWVAAGRTPREFAR